MSLTVNFEKLTEVALELRRERDDAQEALIDAQARIIELRRQLGAQRRYSEALERQLEPSVIEEIKTELSEEAGE